MLSKKIYFSHNFDEKMHYAMHYSLLKDTDGIYVNDSVRSKKCNRKLGRWNFSLAGEEYSCGTYYALEIIRQSVFSAIKNNKNSVDIALVPAENDSDVRYMFNCEKPLDIDELKSAQILPNHEDDENCTCDTKISKRIFFKVVKPVLEEVFKDKIVEEGFAQFSIDFKRDLNVIHIEWRF